MSRSKMAPGTSISNRTDIQLPFLRRSCTRPSMPRLMLNLPLHGVSRPEQQGVGGFVLLMFVQA
jgi:hypothetical protein